MEHTVLGFPPLTVGVFAGFVIVALLIDLFAHKKDEPISLKNASIWSAFWIMISLAFAGYLYLDHGAETASLFLTGYALEKVLSVDNLMVFVAIFAWFKIPDEYRHRVLYWGIIGAIVFRAIFVGIGTFLMSLSAWVEIFFALFIALSAYKMLTTKEDEISDFSRHIAYRIGRRLFPVWPNLVGNKFFVRRSYVDSELQKPENSTLNIGKKGAFLATPLFLCVIVVELSDVMFAFDSVPAVIAVSREPLIIYSAMMFAILGLRTLYFVLEALKKLLVHLEKAVIALLFFIAGKLILNATDHIFHHGFAIDPNVSLFIVLGVLTLGILASLVFPEKEEATDSDAQDHDEQNESIDRSPIVTEDVKPEMEAPGKV